jgi:uncharacterized membrane protein
MSLYEASVALHVAAAITGFGPTFAYPFIQLSAERAGIHALPLALGTVLRISRTLAVPSTLVVGITGAYQVADGPFELGDAWVAAGVVLYAVIMALAVLWLAPQYARMKEAAERMLEAGASDWSGEYRSLRARLAVVGPLEAGAVLGTVLLMEVKPG